MNAAVEPKELTGEELILRVQASPGIVLTDPKLWETYYATLEKDASTHKADVSTQKGRDAITARKMKLVKARTSIEAARKDMTEDWRIKTNQVNAAGKLIRETLEALQNRVSAPVDAWKQAEDAKKTENNDTIVRLRQCVLPPALTDTPESVLEKLTWARGINDLSVERFGDQHEIAVAAHEAAIAALTGFHARLVQAEKDRAELQRLRDEADAAQRQRDEESRQKAAQEMADARQRDEDARVAKASEAAAEAARQEADREAQALLDAKQAEINRLEKQRQDEANAAAWKAKQESDAKAAQEAADLKRQQDEAHRGRVNAAARDALMEHAGLTKEQATAAVIAVARLKIAAVTISY